MVGILLKMVVKRGGGGFPYPHPFNPSRFRQNHPPPPPPPRDVDIKTIPSPGVYTPGTKAIDADMWTDMCNWLHGIQRVCFSLKKLGITIFYFTLFTKRNQVYFYT
jgi:hypothetical protein